MSFLEEKRLTALCGKPRDEVTLDEFGEMLLIVPMKGTGIIDDLRAYGLSGSENEKAVCVEASRVYRNCDHGYSGTMLEFTASLLQAFCAHDMSRAKVNEFFASPGQFRPIVLIEQSKMRRSRLVELCYESFRQADTPAPVCA